MKIYYLSPRLSYKEYDSLFPALTISSEICDAISPIIAKYFTVFGRLH